MQVCITTNSNVNSDVSMGYDQCYGRMIEIAGYYKCCRACVWKLLDFVDGRNEQLAEPCWSLIWSWDADDLQQWNWKWSWY